jgi:predicted phage-related endonuclease
MSTYKKTISRERESQAGISGTDIGAVMGKCPWRGALSVYLKKKGLVDPDYSDSKQDRLYWGTKHEATVRESFLARHSEFVKCETDVYVDKMIGDNVLAVGHPDGILITETGAEVGLEVKVASGFTRKNWPDSESGAIPIHYLMQCLWYMYITGIAKWNLVVLIDNFDYREYIIYADGDNGHGSNLELIEKMIDGAIDFWENNVMLHCPPLAVACDDAKVETSVDLVDYQNDGKGDEVMVLSEKLRVLSDTSRDVDKRVADLRAALQFKLGGNCRFTWATIDDKGQDHHYSLHFSPVMRKASTDWEMIAKEQIPQKLLDDVLGSGAYTGDTKSYLKTNLQELRKNGNK